MALPKLITRDHQQAGLYLASERCQQPDAGLFGPGSIFWQLIRENLMTLCQGRILLMMLADSRTAQLIQNDNDAIQRLHHTQVFLLKLVFGNLDQVLLTLESHRERRRTLFELSDSNALLFAVSAWLDSCQLMYSEIVEPLTTAHQERLFEETMLLAQVLGVPQEHLPRHWHAHRSWWQRQLKRPYPVCAARRQLGHQLIREQGFPGRVPYGSYLALAPFQLPEALRRAFLLPDNGLAQHRLYQQRLKGLMDTTRRLPARLRYQPAYHEAIQRLDGRARADWTTRLLNRWWTGQPDLVNSGWSLPKMARLPTASFN
ncbi:MAG: oxygenase MpaB family protein [Alcanivorax sp.]|nr:oxygenase MpaB family protein [Alcanivorax sp.]